MKTETTIIQPTWKKIALPNKKKGTRIKLNELLTELQTNESFKARMDKDLNPNQNWIEININGKLKIFSNGTAVTNLDLPDESLIVFCEKLYNAYVREHLE